MAVRANGNTVPNAITLLSSKNVMYIQKSRIIPRHATLLPLALPVRPAEYDEADALITLDMRPCGDRFRDSVTSKQREVNAWHVVKCVVQRPPKSIGLIDDIQISEVPYTGVPP